MAERSFMDGYERDGQTADRLIAVLRNAVYTMPDQRFGQMLCNAIRMNPSLDLDPSLGLDDLFNLRDEDLIQVLTAYYGAVHQPRS